jgi:hypothetical protein
VLCKTGEKAVDILIPVLMPNKNGDYIISENNLTYFSVQVKNWKNGGKPTIWPVHNPQFSTSQISVNMLLQLGGKETPFEFFEEKNSTCLSFASYGLTENHFPLLKHQELSRINDDELTKEMVATLDPEKLTSSQMALCAFLIYFLEMILMWPDCTKT